MSVVVHHHTALMSYCLILYAQLRDTLVLGGPEQSKPPTPADPENVKEMIAAQDLHSELQFPQ